MALAEAVYKSSCCLTVHSISHYSPDVLKRHAGLALPLAFLGMHQVAEEEQTENTHANLWGEVWQDHVPGTLCVFGFIMRTLTHLFIYIALLKLSRSKAKQ